MLIHNNTINTCYIWYKRKHTTSLTLILNGNHNWRGDRAYLTNCKNRGPYTWTRESWSMSAVVLTHGVVGARSISCGSDATQRIKIARPSVRWLSSAESHERTNAVRPLLRLWLPGNKQIGVKTSFLEKQNTVNIIPQALPTICARCNGETLVTLILPNNFGTLCIKLNLHRRFYYKIFRIWLLSSIFVCSSWQSHVL